MIFNVLIKNTIKHIELKIYWKHKHQNTNHGYLWVGLWQFFLSDFLYFTSILKEHILVLVL